MARIGTSWKKVGYAVVAAGVGATIFGAAHYMFLSNIPVGGFMGITYQMMFPFILGIIGFVGAYKLKLSENMQNVLLFGSAAAIGFGIAEVVFKQVATEYKFKAQAAARASYAPARYYPPLSAPAPVYNGITSGGGAGVKMI